MSEGGTRPVGGQIGLELLTDARALSPSNYVNTCFCLVFLTAGEKTDNRAENKIQQKFTRTKETSNFPEWIYE